MTAAPEWRIREARPADLDSVRGICHRSSLSNKGDREALLDRPDLLVLGDEAIREERMRVATLPSGETVGFASLGPTSGEPAELEDLFVAPEWMGRGVDGRGVGRALVAVIDSSRDALVRVRVSGRLLVSP